MFRYLPVQSGDPEHAVSVARATEDIEVVDKVEVVAVTSLEVVDIENVESVGKIEVVPS